MEYRSPLSAGFSLESCDLSSNSPFDQSQSPTFQNSQEGYCNKRFRQPPNSPYDISRSPDFRKSQESYCNKRFRRHQNSPYDISHSPESRNSQENYCNNRFRRHQRLNFNAPNLNHNQKNVPISHYYHPSMLADPWKELEAIRQIPDFSQQ